MRAGRWLIFVPLLLVCGQVAAQVGSLEVTVRNAESEAPLPGATVTLSSEQGLLAPTTVITGQEGLAGFPVLRAGSGYIVEVSMPGFAGRRVKDLRVHAGLANRIGILLSSEIRERVEVRAQGAVVELDSIGHASKFDEIFIQNLPVAGRFYQNMLSLAPGVQDADSDGNPNVHGGRTRDFRAVVGGVSNTDPLTGEWLSRINSDSIEEIEMLPAGAGVEFGRASAGFSRILQKQGSNDFEGVAGFLYRSSKLDGGGTAGVSQERIPEFEWLQPSIQVSGAILKNRLWYRLSHERIKREDPLDLISRLEIVSLEGSMNSDQITWQVSPRNKLSFQYQSDPLEIDNYNLSSKVSSESTQTLKRGGDEYRLRWTAPQSARLLVTSLVAWQDSYHDILPTTTQRWNGCAYFYDFPALNEARCLNENTGLVSGPHHESWRDKRQRLTVSSEATYYAGRHWGMSHRLKFGFISENERFYRELDRGPDMSFVIPLTIDGSDNLAYVNARASAPRSSHDRATGVNWALYIEDQIHPVENVAITLGMRLDRSEIDSAGQETFDPQSEADAYYQLLASGLPPSIITPAVFTAFHDIGGFQRDLANALGAGTSDVPVGSTAQQSAFWLHDRGGADIALRNSDVSPRLSVSWDPWSNGKTKLALSAGRYYDKIFLAVPLLEMEPAWTDLSFLAYKFAYWLPYFVYNLQGGFSSTISSQMVDRDLRTPYQDEFTLSFERALWPETSLKISYIRRKYRDQLQDVDINHAQGDKGRCLATVLPDDPTVEASDGEGQLLVDPFTGAEYFDSDPGPGDGLIDDCMGDVVRVGGTFGYDKAAPDGLPDLYVLNPGWGELLLVGNFNASEYTAYMIELVRRQYRNWQMKASYTWSEAEGDAEDFDQILGNERSLVEDEQGYLSWDQRHVVKVSAVTLTPWGVRLGGTVRWESGLPFSELSSKRTAFSVPVDYGQGDPDVRYRLRYPTGQRNDQRNPSYWTLDLKGTKEFALPGGMNFQVSADIFNLLDDNSLRIEDRINGQGTGVRRFGRRYQIALRLSF